MKALLEEAAFLSLRRSDKDPEKLQLEESLGNRSQRVKGPKKLLKSLSRLQMLKKSRSLLAQSLLEPKLYQGERLCF